MTAPPRRSVPRGPPARCRAGRVDAESVQPGLVVSGHRQLRDPDDVAVLDREPEPSATVAHPLVEEVGDVVLAPDPRAERAHRPLVLRLRGADTERPDFFHPAS